MKTRHSKHTSIKFNIKNTTKPKRKKLTETSTSKIWRHLYSTNPKELVIISPFRTEYSNQENMKRLIQLKNEVRKMNYGFIECLGYWRNPEDDNDKSMEISLMIPKMNWKKGLELGKKYEQYSIIAKNGDKLAMIRCKDNICETRFNSIKKELNINDAQNLIDNFDNQKYINKKLDSATRPKRTKHPFGLSKDTSLNYDTID